MNKDTRSQLEREFDQMDAQNFLVQFPHQKLLDLVKILKQERDAWKYNFQQAEKDRIKLLEKIHLLEGAVNILRD